MNPVSLARRRSIAIETTHVGGVVIVISDNGIAGGDTQTFVQVVGVAVRVASRSRCCGDGADEGDSEGRDGDRELHS